MSHFEKIGVDYQYSAKNAKMAKKSFEKSCNKCCTQGKHLECNRCAISEAHSSIMMIFSH